MPGPREGMILVRERKPRPPVGQQGMSRAYINDPNGPVVASTPASRRTLIIVRATQMVLLAAALFTFTVVDQGRQEFSFLTYVFLWPAVLLDYVIRSRIRQQPPPTTVRKAMAVLGVAAVALWFGWALYLQIHGLSYADRRMVWIVTGCVGYGVIVAGVAAAQRARYFSWNPAKTPTPWNDHL